jgi:glycosyltransferase involved in cell wall biosynthesis
MEAMACGLPVAAMAVGGVAEIVRAGETGFVVKAGDEAGLVEAVFTLAADPSLRGGMGKRAREFVEREHSLESLARHLAALYERVLA